MREVEYMLDVHKCDLPTLMEHPDQLVRNIVLSILDRYNYPPCPFSSAIISRYGTNVDAPEGELYWALEDIQERVVRTKEIVIRSDSLITHQFWYPTQIGNQPKHENRQIFYLNLLGPDGVVHFTEEVKAKLPVPFRIPYLGRNEVPDAVACFLPYAPGEMVVQWPQELDENGQAEISFYNNSSCRHLVVSAQGLSTEGQPASFEKEL